MNFREINLKNIGILPKNIQYIIAGLVFLIVLFLGYLVDLSSLSNELFIDQQQEVDFKSQLTTALTKLNSMKTATDQIPVLQKQIQSYTNNMPTQDEIPSILQEISKQSTANGLDLKLLEPQSEINEKLYSSLPVHIVITGNYSNLSKFLNNILEYSNYLSIDDFALEAENSPADTSKTNHEITMDAKATIHFIDQERQSNKS